MTDIEIARNTILKNITEIAKKIPANRNRSHQ